MPNKVFELQAKPISYAHEDWKTCDSNYRLPITTIMIVLAASENEARKMAHLDTLKVVEVSGFSELPLNTWINSDITVCDEIKNSNYPLDGKPRVLNNF